ncbi:MAG: hypothetical protein KDC98_06820 [Planctomycetes bacterium]|nr:hypothetical protein [Planctomycetota bacterium]
MQLHRFVLAAALSAPALLAQTAADVGLTMSGGVLTVIYGQNCGTFTCQPFVAGTTAAGQPYDVSVWGAPNQPFVLAADLPTGAPCIQIAGVANSLLLQNQPITLATGMIGSGSAIGVCNQGRARYALQFPAGTPVGVQYLLQGVAMSASLRMPAFTVAITSRTG